MEMKDKVAVVTGGAGGIGLATARMLVTAGVAVVLADVDPVAGLRSEAELTESGGKALFVRADVTDIDSVTNLFASACEAFGGVDILFNNAGVLGGPRFPEAPPASWLKAININIVGVMNCIHVGVPYLAKRSNAVIVNTSSTAGLKSSHLDPAYAMTKAAVVSLTRSLTFLEKESGIRINCVCPALVKTGLEQNSSATYSDAELKAFREGRAGRTSLPSLTPEEVAAAVIRLIEDDSLNGYACAMAVGQPLEMIPAVAPQKV